MLRCSPGSVLTNLEQPDDDQYDDEYNPNGIEALLTDPMLDLVGSVGFVCVAGVLVGVEELPTPIDTDGHSDDGVNGETDGIAFHKRVNLSNGTDESVIAHKHLI